MMIKSLKDLARVVGVKPNMSAVSRAIYKATSCGAWVKSASTKDLKLHAGTRPVKFTLRGRLSIGRILWKTPLANGKPIRPDDTALLKEIKFYLQGYSDHKLIQIIIAQSKIKGSGIRRTRKNDVFISWTANVSRKDVHHDGVMVGSIVEGSDAEVGPYILRYPFSSTVWWDLIKEVDQEASAIYEERN